MWKIRRERGYISVRSEDVYAVIDPTKIPEDVLDIDFVILTSKPRNPKVIDEILRRSKATLVGTPKNVRRYSLAHYTDEVDKLKGLAPGLWVAPLEGKVAVGVDSERGYAVIVSDRSQRPGANELGMKIYGEKGKILVKDEINEEEI